MVQLVLHSNWSGFRITTSQASAFSPCNITGFFRIHDSARDPLRIGSTGVGVALGTGVTTIVSLRRTRHPRIVARFNNDQLTTEAVSIKVARRYCELDGRPWDCLFRDRRLLSSLIYAKWSARRAWGQ